MKVLVFTSLYPNNIWPNQGVFIKERVTHVAKLEECEVKVVAPVPYFPAVKLGARWRFSQVVRQEVREGIETRHPRYYIVPKVGMVFYGLSMFMSLLPYLRSMQRTFAFDLIDAHFVYPDGMAAIFLGRFLRKPVIVSARGSDINVYKDLVFIRPLLRWTLERASAIIAVSQALKEAIKQLGLAEEKICVIPNGVDTEKFFPITKADARQRLGIGDTPLILAVGNITANKGFDLLIGALRILVDERSIPDLSLVVVGEGIFRKELEQRIAYQGLGSRVKLVGAVPHLELRYWYSAADIFCLASAQEGWPNVVLESLACGTPVVATAVGGIPEIISSPELGILTDRNEREMAERITQGLRKEWRKETIVRYAREQTWEKVAKSVFQVFSEVVTDRKVGVAIGTGATAGHMKF